MSKRTFDEIKREESQRKRTTVQESMELQAKGWQVIEMKFEDGVFWHYLIPPERKEQNE